jgi:uncharacterized protein with FMN-binding domain
MKRISYWFLSTLSALVLLFGYHTSTSGAQAAGSPSAIVSTGTPGGSSSSGSSTGTTLTGGVASTQWGPVQVQLTMSGDTITHVTVLQQPSGNGKDAEINSYALPILISETEQAGTSQIDMVSGATVTSTGYIQSLQSALDRA